MNFSLQIILTFTLLLLLSPSAPAKEKCRQVITCNDGLATISKIFLNHDRSGKLFSESVDPLLATQGRKLTLSEVTISDRQSSAWKTRQRNNGVELKFVLSHPSDCQVATGFSATFSVFKNHQFVFEIPMTCETEILP